MITHDRPLGLHLLAWLLWFWAGAAFLMTVLIAAGSGPIMLGGEALPRDEALARLLPVLIPMILAAAGAALAIALDRHWARSAILLPLAIVAVGPVFAGTADDLRDLAAMTLALVPAAALLVWYLFFRPGVVAHFQRLRQRRDAAS